MTARTPEDLLAAAPAVLGFWPDHCVVLMTFGARHPFHARTDLPPAAAQTPAVQRAVGERLLGPARRHGATHVVLLYYGADRDAETLHRHLRRVCRRSGLGVILALHADGTHYRDLDEPPPESRPPRPHRRRHHPSRKTSRQAARQARRHPYDVSTHPFVLEAIVSGRLAHRSRAELAASIDQDPVAAAATAAALGEGGVADAGVPATGRAIRDAGEWVLATVRRLLAAGTEPTPAELARLLWLMQSPRVRDAAWSELDRASADAHVRLWSGAVRRAPDTLVAAPAALLGWSAWQAGDGALAWIAVDRCLAASPGYRLAEHLGAILQQALPPEHWTGSGRWDRGLPAH